MKSEKPTFINAVDAARLLDIHERDFKRKAPGLRRILLGTTNKRRYFYHRDEVERMAAK